MKKTIISTKSFFNKIKKIQPELNLEYKTSDRTIRSKNLIHNHDTNFKYNICALIALGDILCIRFDFGEIKQGAETFQLVNDFNYKSRSFYKAYLEFYRSKISCHFVIEYISKINSITNAAADFFTSIKFMNTEEFVEIIRPIYSLTVLGKEDKVEQMA